MKNTQPQGFTLVEMSIVLMIIGAIVGTIIVSQNLIVNSRLQVVLTDADNYTTAANNFKQTYLQLPGDFTTATNLWGTDPNGCTNGGGNSGTCNGNGNGQLSIAGGASQVGEMFLFWQHLYLANMTSQKSANNAGSGGTTDTIIGVNAPAGSIKGSGFSAMWVGTATSDTHLFDGYYGNALFFGGSRQSISGTVDYSYTRDGILTTDQAQALDTKIDDGMPGTGKIRAFKSTSTLTPSCTTTAVYNTAQYNLGTSNFCSLAFIMGL